MPPWSLRIDTPAEILLTLLIVGHLFADFFVQTACVAQRKRERASYLLLHAALTFLVHLLLVLPFWNPPLVGGVLLLAVAHAGLDAIKIKLEARWPGSLLLFFADQSAHLVLILLLWHALQQLDLLGRPLLPFDPTWMPEAAGWLIVAAGLTFNGKGGTSIVRLLLERFPQVVPREAEGYNMGRTIGVLERVLIFTLVLLNQWGALGLVLAAKSIARFKELNTQHFADYYLIGTLTSMLVAIGTGVIVRLLVF
jgi:hypothetical protein